MESFSDVWMNVPLGVVRDFLADVTEEAWNTGNSIEEYDRLESVRASLERVVGYLATQRPAQLAPRGSQELPVLGGKQRARGRVCFKCRGQIRSTQEMVTICPVWVPGLPVHKSCFESLDQEFGGRQ